ncbi:MAG: hypothetical protein ACKOFW_12795, partial [Planctomycetaceae bacterium]
AGCEAGRAVMIPPSVEAGRRWLLDVNDRAAGGCCRVNTRGDDRGANLAGCPWWVHAAMFGRPARHGATLVKSRNEPACEVSRS